MRQINEFICRLECDDPRRTGGRTIFCIMYHDQDEVRQFASDMICAKLLMDGAPNAKLVLLGYRTEGEEDD